MIHMPSCLRLEIRLAKGGEFHVRYELLQNDDGRIIGIHFYDELHYPYENRGLSSMIAVNWRGAVVYIPAPESLNEDGRPWPTPFTYAAPYADRVAAAVAGISRLESDYQRQLFEQSRSR